MTTPPFQRPDWVMCGIPWDDGKVAILASTELSQAELEGQRDAIYPIDPYEVLGPVAMGSMRYTLRVEMRGFVIVVADTYEHAFRSLFEKWSPQRQTRGQLGGHRPAIAPGRS